MSLTAALKAWTPEHRETLRSLRDKLETDALKVEGVEVVGGIVLVCLIRHRCESLDALEMRF